MLCSFEWFFSSIGWCINAGYEFYRGYVTYWNRFTMHPDNLTNLSVIIASGHIVRTIISTLNSEHIHQPITWRVLKKNDIKAYIFFSSPASYRHGKNPIYLHNILSSNAINLYIDMQTFQNKQKIENARKWIGTNYLYKLSKVKWINKTKTQAMTATTMPFVLCVAK